MGIWRYRCTACFICGSVRCPSADGQSELQISEANAGATPAKCTADPDLSGSARQ
jgi:hypothetical protein